MSAHFESACARTDAVLATHLDGDLADAQVESGFEFVSEDTLQEHLRDCNECQRALRRARRLDAALASGAGSTLAQHAVATGEQMDALADRLLQRAVESGSQPETPAAQTPEMSLPWTMFAAAGLIAATVASWLFLVKPSTAPISQESMAQQTDPSEPQRPSKQPGTRDAAEPTEEPAPAAVRENPSIDPELPIAIARHLHDRGRSLPNQATLSVEELAARIDDEQLELPVRMAAGDRLIRASRHNSRRAQHAFDHLLAAIAARGDRTADDIALQEHLLEELRDSSTLRSHLGSRLIASVQRRHGDDDDVRLTVAAVVAAARIGTPSLDSALRRAVRHQPELAAAMSSALRCGARHEGTARLLLASWNDQVSLGNQQDTSNWAMFWFAGQSPETFTELAARLENSRSATERVRCLLAMGCVSDDSTVELLLAQMRSQRRGEAHAAACALSTLPHRVLTPLVAAAKPTREGMLRTALARAGVPAASPWLAHLTTAQRKLLREASLERFPDVIAIFRNVPAIAD